MTWMEERAPWTHAQDRSQCAMSTAGDTGASVLVSGIVELLYKSAGDGTALPKLPSGHPLFKTLSAHASAPTQLLACFEALLVQPEESAELRRRWLLWQPFVSLATLDHGEGRPYIIDSLASHLQMLPRRCLLVISEHHMHWKNIL